MRSGLLNKSLIPANLWLILSVCSAAHALTVFKVATTADDEMLPCVSGNRVVWQSFNSHYGDWDILGAEIANGAAAAGLTLGDFNGDDLFPIIDGNDVVWQHHNSEDSDGDIYGARIANGRSVSRFAVSVTNDDERLPYVSDGAVVWQHKLVGVPDWDILGARLTGRDDPEPFVVSAIVDVNELFPCISSNLVVWQERASDLPQPFVSGAEISDANNPLAFYTYIALGKEQIPSLSDGWLVARETDGPGKVIVDNLFDPFNPESISSSTRTASPRIHKHIVVWQDQSNGTWDIRGYNLITRREFAITNLKMSDQVNPAVYVDIKAKRATVVWQDNRDGNWDIYAAIVDGPDAATQAAGE